MLLFNQQADGFLINSKNEKSLYEIAVIATTITFGLFTIQFSIRALSNSANEKRLLLLNETNKILKSYFQEYLSGNRTDKEKIKGSIYLEFDINNDSFCYLLEMSRDLYLRQNRSY